MVKLESLKKSNQFRKALKEKKVHTDYFSIFAAKNFFKAKLKPSLLIIYLYNRQQLKYIPLNIYEKNISAQQFSEEKKTWF